MIGSIQFLFAEIVLKQWEGFPPGEIEGVDLLELIEHELTSQVDRDGDLRGQVDRWHHYDVSGKEVRVESDRNFDGKPDLFHTR